METFIAARGNKHIQATKKSKTKSQEEYEMKIKINKIKTIELKYLKHGIH